MKKLFVTLSVAAVIGAASITAFAATTTTGTPPVTSAVTTSASAPTVNSSLEKSTDSNTQSKPAVERDRRDGDREDYCPGYRDRDGDRGGDRGGRYGGCWN
ncbi:hypothetical protein [Pectinatus brassicae]|uniref:Uncharacterized protein n=1 Tax=Pectinatus brassicae TaxID=862415 RepID=A0A840UVD2_9FIRM|nr:hypothetical protein [Pectinatus brassicae]MBB5336405.1 hypothetical protein [Pectinatus brassicae]